MRRKKIVFPQADSKLRSMNILHIGSKSIHVSSYVTALQRPGMKQYLVSEIECGFDDIVSELNVSFRKMTPAFILKNSRLLKRFIAEVKPDVIHVHQVTRLGFFAARIARKLNIPVLTTAWGSDVLLMPQQNKIYQFLVKDVLKKSAYVTADSQDMIDAMQKVLRSETKYVKLQYGITPVEAVEKQKIIFSNRILRPLYRIDRVIGYFAEFSKNHPDWELRVGANGTEEENLLKLAKELGVSGKVTFLGYLQTEQNRIEYAKAKIFVSIPESDGTSVSLLEAMSAGCIPVVSNLNVSKEWIRDNVNGIIEKTGENPFEKAIELNAEKVAGMNSEIIQREATREASLKVFNGFYEELTNGKK